jgi:hypothetical protein
MDFICNFEGDDLLAGKAIGEPFDRNAMGGTAMITLRVLVTAAAMLMAAAAATAQDYGSRPLRFGNTSGWYYDGREDSRDFPTNGYFPGNFAADPASALFGAEGIFGSNPRRSALPYPSQVVFGPTDQRTACAERYRSRGPQARAFVGTDGARHRC